MSTISPNPRKELADQYKTLKSQKDELQANHETEVDNLKKSYSAEKANLEDRFEQSVQSERSSHYDQLRNTKRQMMSEERRLEDQRRQIVGDKKDELTKEAIKTEQEGKSNVDSIKQKYTVAEEYERNRSLEAQEQVRTTHKQSAEAIIADSNKKVQTLQEQKDAELVKQKETYSQSSEQVKKHYDDIRLNTTNQYSKGVEDLQVRAENDLDQRRLAAMIKVHNYATRQEDPFYNMKRFDSNISDIGDAYVLKVKVPEYERDQFKVQVSAQELRISGVRATNEQAEVEPGRWVTTSSYQNVSEKMQLDAPVDGKSMTVVHNGDWVEYTIPKFGPNRRINDLYKPAAVVDMDRADKQLTKELEFGQTLQQPTQRPKASL